MNQLHLSRWIGIALLVCGCVFMAYGACRGEVAVVLKKAVNICLECIGIG